MTDGIRLAVLGCGAITREGHLPAVVNHPDVCLVALIDRDVGRAEALRRSLGLDCEVKADYRLVLGQVEAVINALPNHLHAPVTLEALRRGVHVLCEKPLAITTSEAVDCCQVADNHGVLLAAGMNRRFEAGQLLLRLTLQDGLLGRLQDYDWEYGMPWDWQTASGFYLSRAQAGGGVLIDSGIHLLDSLVDWFGPVAHIEYQDDNWGSGIEANAILQLRHVGPYGEIGGRVRLSRMFKLKNRLAVHGDQACAEIWASNPSAVVLRRKLGGQEVTMTLGVQSRQAAPFTNSFYAQLDNFIKSIRGKERLAADGWCGLEVLRLVEYCYTHTQRIPEPWSGVSETRSETCS